MAAPGVLSAAAVDVGVYIAFADLSFSPPLQLQVNSKQQATVRAIAPSMLPSSTLTAMPGLMQRYAALRYPIKLVAAKPINGCLPPTNPAELRGAVAIMIRGNCTFRNKGKAAENAGAVAAIVYNNRSGSWLTMGYDDPPPIPMWGVMQGEGLAIMKAVGGKSGASLSLKAAKWREAETYKLTVEPAFFSSWGPVSATVQN